MVGLSRLVAAKANSRGITEAELLAARVGPDLDSEGTARAVPLTCTSKGPDMSSRPERHTAGRTGSGHGRAQQPGQAGSIAIPRPGSGSVSVSVALFAAPTRATCGGA